MKRKINNVLLMSPTAYSSSNSLDINPLPPMGLGYLAGTLKEYGYNLKIIDSLGMGWKNKQEVHEGIIRIGLSDEQLVNETELFKPDIVGISNLFSKQFGNALNLARLIKKVSKNIIIVIGGAHPTADPQSVMEHLEFDYLIEGEGEIPLLKLVQYLNGVINESELESIHVREGDKVNFYQKKNWVDFNTIPPPAFDLMDLELYFGLNSSHGLRRYERFMPIITSRGCPALCTFCTAHKVWGRKFRTRSIESVISEMKFLKKEYNVRELMFEDDNVTLDTKRAATLFNEMIHEKLDFVWDTPNGVAPYALNNETLVLMKTAGCYHVNLAIESGNQQHLSKNIRKPVKLERVAPLVETCRKLDLSVNTFLVFGIPGETKDMIWDSARFVASLGIYRPFISIATPYPGSDLFRLCKEKGYLVSNFSIEDLYIRSFCISTPDLPAEELRRLLVQVQMWLKYKEFASRPIPFVLEQIKETIDRPERIRGFLAKFMH